MSGKRLTYQELEKKLAEAEAQITALRKTDHDALLRKRNAARDERDRSKFERNKLIQDSLKIEKAYVASEQNFRNSLDACPLGVRIVTAKGELIYTNQAMLDICGYASIDELNAVSKKQLYTPASYIAFLDRRTKRKAGEYTPPEYEIAIRRPDGEVRNLQVFRTEVMWSGQPQFMVMYRDITERKQMEEALKDSEEKFHSIVEHSNDGIIFVQNGQISYFNSKMLELGDYTADDIAYKPFLDFVAPQDKKKVAEIYSKRIAGEDMPERYELTLLAKGGRSVYVEISASLFKYKGEVADMAIIRDITERKKAEEALRESEKVNRLLADYYKRLNTISITFNEAVDTADLFEKIAESFRLLTGAIAASFSSYDPEARVLKVTSLSIDPILRDSVLSMLGIDLFKMRIPVSTADIEQMLMQGIRRPKDLHELSSGKLPRDISDSVMDAIECRQIIALAISYAGEIMGTCVAYLRGAQPVVPDEALKTYISFSGLAIKRQQAEEALRQAEFQYRTVADFTYDWEYWENPDGFYRYISPSCERISGYKANEFISNPGLLSEIVAPEDKEIWLQHLHQVAQKRGKYELRFRIQRKDGDICWIEHACQPVFDDQGKFLGHRASHRDITKRKKAEEALRRSEEKYRGVVELIPDGIVTLDKSGFITTVSKAVFQITGFPDEELVGKHISRVPVLSLKDVPKALAVFGSIIRAKGLRL